MIAHSFNNTQKQAELTVAAAKVPTLTGSIINTAAPNIVNKHKANRGLKTAAQAKFSNAAEQYNNHANVQKHAASDLFKLINADSQNKNKLCVDLGAGPLVNTQQLKSEFGSVVAIDLSLTMLTTSALNTPRICADMDNLPLRKNSVDVIFSNFAVQWSTNFTALMQSLYSILKPGGQAYISTVVAGSLYEINTAFAALDSNSHINTFSTKEHINQSVQKVGFAINSKKNVVYSDCYATPLKAIKSIKAIGANTHNHTNTRQGLLTKSALHQVCNAYPLINNQACVSYHVVLLSLQKR